MAAGSLIAALAITFCAPHVGYPQAAPLSQEAEVAIMLDRVNGAAGLPQLRESILPPGTRELRFLASDGGMMWRGLPLLRIVQTPDSVFGEVYLVWYDRLDSTGTPIEPNWVVSSGDGCVARQYRPGLSSCKLPLWHISWPEVADTLDRLGAWDLFPTAGLVRRGDRTVDSSAGGLIVTVTTEQGSIFGEARIGDHYGSLWYSAPDRLAGPEVPPLRRVAAIVKRLSRQ